MLGVHSIMKLGTNKVPVKCLERKDSKLKFFSQNQGREFFEGFGAVSGQKSCVSWWIDAYRAYHNMIYKEFNVFEKI